MNKNNKIKVKVLEILFPMWQLFFEVDQMPGMAPLGNKLQKPGTVGPLWKLQPGNGECRARWAGRRTVTQGQIARPWQLQARGPGIQKALSLVLQHIREGLGTRFRGET